MLSAYYNRDALIVHHEIMRYKLIQMENNEDIYIYINVAAIHLSAVKP